MSAGGVSPGGVSGPGGAGSPGDGSVPEWLRPLAEAAPHVRPEELSRFVPPPGERVRHSAVLILFGEGLDGPDLLLTQRATTLRSHAGQPAFPGGSADPGDASPAETALREAAEEVGLDPSGVRVLAELPGLWLPPSGFVVTPVLAWWERPSPVSVADPREVASVTRVPVAELVDPERRWQVTHPSGYTGPAFDVRGMLVWGFTAGLLDRLLEVGGLARPWDATRLRPLPEEALRLAARTTPRAAEPPEPAVTAAGDAVTRARGTALGGATSAGADGSAAGGGGPVAGGGGTVTGGGGWAAGRGRGLLQAGEVGPPGQARRPGGS